MSDTTIQSRRLTRARTGAIFGVCSGLAQYLGVERLLVRLAFVLFTLAGGAGVLAYIVLALTMPEDAVHGAQPSSSASERSVQIAGVGLILLGVWLLAGSLGLLSGVRWDLVWAFALVALGLAVLLRDRRIPRG
jgi:phage shock protein PspC (stress-responsive transcriptional regulator)